MNAPRAALDRRMTADSIDLPALLLDASGNAGSASRSFFVLPIAIVVSTMPLARMDAPAFD